MRKERIIPRRNNDPLNENIPVDHLLQYEDINKPQTFGLRLIDRTRIVCTSGDYLVG